MTRTCRTECCLIDVCSGAEGGAPWRPYGDGGRHGWGVFFLPSFHLANRVSEVPQPQNHQKKPLSQLISPSIMVGWGRLKYLSYAHARSEDACAI